MTGRTHWNREWELRRGDGHGSASGWVLCDALAEAGAGRPSYVVGITIPREGKINAVIKRTRGAMAHAMRLMTWK